MDEQEGQHNVVLTTAASAIPLNTVVPLQTLETEHNPRPQDLFFQADLVDLRLTNKEKELTRQQASTLILSVTTNYVLLSLAIFCLILVLDGIVSYTVVVICFLIAEVIMIFLRYRQIDRIYFVGRRTCLKVFLKGLSTVQILDAFFRVCGYLVFLFCDIVLGRLRSLCMIPVWLGFVFVLLVMVAEQDDNVNNENNDDKEVLIFDDFSL